MMRTRVGALVLGLVALGAVPAAGQGVSVELRVGAAVGNYTGTGAGLDLVPAPSFAAVGELALTESLSGYLGINRSAFGCDEALCVGRDMSLSSQGVTIGARYALGMLWARGGLALQVLRVSSDAETSTSDPGVGWDLGAGVEIPVGRGFLVRPGVTYLRHNAPIGADSGHVTALAAEIGVAMRF